MNGTRKNRDDGQGATKDIDQINEELEEIEQQLNSLIGADEAEDEEADDEEDGAAD
jgi:dynactin complex subunit